MRDLNANCWLFAVFERPKLSRLLAAVSAGAVIRAILSTTELSERAHSLRWGPEGGRSSKQDAVLLPHYLVQRALLCYVHQERAEQ